MLFLSRNGVGDLEYVMNLSPSEAMGMMVVLARFEGLSFDWNKGEFKPAKD